MASTRPRDGYALRGLALQRTETLVTVLVDLAGVAVFALQRRGAEVAPRQDVPQFRQKLVDEALHQMPAESTTAFQHDLLDSTAIIDEAVVCLDEFGGAFLLDGRTVK